MVSKIEKSRHYDEIIRMLSNGESSRAISKHLEESYNEKISRSTISRFKKNQFNKIVIHEADKIREAEIIDSVDTTIDVEDCIGEVANQYNELLKLNKDAISFFKDFINDDSIDISKRTPYAFKVMALTFKYSLNHYFKLDINKSDDSYFMELVRDSERFNKLASECDEYYNTVDDEFNEI